MVRDVGTYGHRRRGICPLCLWGQWGGLGGGGRTLAWVRRDRNTVLYLLWRGGWWMGGWGGTGSRPTQCTRGRTRQGARGAVMCSCLVGGTGVRTITRGKLFWTVGPPVCYALSDGGPRCFIGWREKAAESQGAEEGIKTGKEIKVRKKQINPNGKDTRYYEWLSN